MVTQKHSVLKDVPIQHRYVGQVLTNIPEHQQTVVYVLKAVVEAQPIVLLDQQRYCAVSRVADSALQTIQTEPAVLYVTMVQQQVLLDVRRPGVATLTNLVDLVVLLSGPATVIALVQHRLTWLFLQDYLPATVP